jgi:hypothetical protein
MPKTITANQVIKPNIRYSYTLKDTKLHIYFKCTVHYEKNWHDSHPKSVYIPQAKNLLPSDFHYTIFGSDVGSNTGYSEFITVLSLQAN